MSIFVEAAAATKDADAYGFNVLAFERTARRIMNGTVFVPKQVGAGQSLSVSTSSKIPCQCNTAMLSQTGRASRASGSSPSRQKVDKRYILNINVQNLRFPPLRIAISTDFLRDNR